jgi:hypothetical protein
MEAYEIADIGRRALAHPPEVVLRFEVERYLFRLVLENPTQRAAYDVSFSMPLELAWWLDKHQPTALLNGLGVLWPGARLHYLLGSSFEWLSDESTHSRSFTISYTWRSPDHEIRADQLAVDVSQFLGSNAEVTPIERVGDQLNKNLEKLCKQVEQIAKGLDALVSRVSQPTGLALSATTLRNLAHVLARDGEWEKVSMRRDYDVVMDVLGVDASPAFEIWKIYNGHDRKALTDVWCGSAPTSPPLSNEPSVRLPEISRMSEGGATPQRGTRAFRLCPELCLELCLRLCPSLSDPSQSGPTLIACVRENRPDILRFLA